MTAGSILVPQIIPLRDPIPGKAKHEIDTNTLVEIKSDTPDVAIYYTIDGSKPQLSKRLGYRDHNTLKYNGPITISDGKITVKALAVTKDYRESAVVTKMFVVDYVTPDTPVPDEDMDKNFLKVLSRQEMGDGLSELRLRNKEVNMESRFHWNDVAQELQDFSTEKRSVPSHLGEPHLKKNYLNTSSDRKETHFATPIPQLQGKVLCCVCGAGNPIHIKHCVICDSKLPEAQMPGLFPYYFTCFKCFARNYLHNLFCGTCGVFIDPSSRLDAEDIFLNVEDDFVISTNNSFQTLSTPRTNLVKKKEQGTQTIGLFYPSSKHLEEKECELVSQREKQNKVYVHKPLLTAISPGRGYWRRQLDHVCAHLRSYAQNNVAFRTSVGEPQMGKLISATVHEDSYQVSLHINYALAINKDVSNNKPVTLNYNGLRPNKAGRMEFNENQANLANEVSQRMSSSTKDVRGIIKTRTCLEKEDRLTIESRQLLKEVGPKGQGQLCLVEQLIDEGADPNCTNSDDQPALTLAVLNKRHEVIPVLVQKGADIDHQSGPENNTALHEAVLMGMEGLECTEALVGCNADIRKNARGLSASDLALNSGNDRIMPLFASKLG